MLDWDCGPTPYTSATPPTPTRATPPRLPTLDCSLGSTTACADADGARVRSFALVRECGPQASPCTTLTERRADEDGRVVLEDEVLAAG